METKTEFVKGKLKWNTVFWWNIDENGSLNMKLSVLIMVTRGMVKTTLASPS